MVGGARTPGQPGSVDETKRQQPPPVRMDGNPRYRASTNPLSANPKTEPNRMIAYLSLLPLWCYKSGHQETTSGFSSCSTVARLNFTSLQKRSSSLSTSPLKKLTIRLVYKEPTICVAYNGLLSLMSVLKMRNPLALSSGVIPTRSSGMLFE